LIVDISGKYMAKKRGIARNCGNTLPDKIKSELACSRLAVVGDVEVMSKDKEINIQMVKECTGGDASELVTQVEDAPRDILEGKVLANECKNASSEMANVSDVADFW
jgi:hypothetical protein